MKYFLISTSILFLNLHISAQHEEIEKTKAWKFGFNLGINYAQIVGVEGAPQGTLSNNGYGIKLGILAETKLSDRIYFSPKTELSFNSANIDFTGLDLIFSPVYEIMPVSLDIMSHFVFKSKNEKLKPYFLLGPQVRIPIQNNKSSTTTFTTALNFAIDLGIGLDKSFTSLDIAPELRYSYGLLNVNRHPQLQSVYLHNISLVFNFKG